MKVNDSIALFTCAKNEHKYISEWVYYHLKIGFDHIYVCDTSDDNNMKNCSVFSDYRVTCLHEPLNGLSFGRYQYEFQTKYNNQIFKKEYKWCAFIDVDEFIILKKNKYIKDFLNFINFDKGSLGINWVFFGDNNIENYSEEPLLKQFTRSQYDYNKHCKVIVNTNSVDHFNNPHFAILKDGNQINEKNKIYQIGPWQKDSSIDYIQINHYITKSKDEFFTRIKGHHTRSSKDIEYHYIHYFNRNDIYNFYAFDKLYENKYYDDLDKLDYEFYIQSYSDLLINGIINEELANKHYLNKGKDEGRITNLNFDYDDYKNNDSKLENYTNVELWNYYKNQFVIDIKYNKKQCQNISELDYEFYLQYYTELYKNEIYNKEMCLKHYLYKGKDEARKTNLNFDFDYYKENNKDLANMDNIELWNHFKNYGIFENRMFKFFI